jgi:hypothetical protein
MTDKKKIIKNYFRYVGILIVSYLGYKLIAPAFNMNDRPKMYRQTNTIKKDTVTSINIKEMLEYVADSINKTPSSYSDDITTLQNAIVLPDKTFQYNYTLKIDTQKYYMPKFKKIIRKALLDSFVNVPSFKTFKDSSVTVVFNFTNVKMKPLFKIIFTPDKYE